MNKKPEKVYKKLRNSRNQTFSLNKGIIKKLDDLKWGTKINQSELLRKILNFFFENKEELINILKEN